MSKVRQHFPLTKMGAMSKTFLPPPSLPALHRRNRTPQFHMLSGAARNLLRNISRSSPAPIAPATLGALSALPRCAKLYHDPDGSVAIAVCTRRTRLPVRTARKVIDVLSELRDVASVSETLVAVSGPKGAVAAAREAVRIHTGEDILCLTPDEPRFFQRQSSPAGNTEETKELPNSSVASTAEHLPASDEDDPPDPLRYGSRSRLNVLSQSRRRAAAKRPRQKFELVSGHMPSGDQPEAIKFLTDGLLRHNRRYQTLHGVTGSGKTFMMANVIANVNRPTLILAPNKTLAAQLCNELTGYFPRNRVEFFVSHFKYYQPEAYMPTSDKYIAKASSVDPVIDQLRHAATRSLFERNDTIVVASVSSIYGLGLPTEYLEAAIRIHVGDNLEGVTELVENLQQLNYTSKRGDLQLSRGFFEVVHDGVNFSPPWEAEGTVYKICLEGTIVTRIESLDSDTRERSDLGQELVIYPAKHFVTPKERLNAAILQIEDETRLCVDAFKREGRVLEASRLEERVALDVEMMRKVGYCSGAENYTLYLSGRHKSSTACPPETLLDYMPRDGNWLLFIDESHVTVPQISGMHAGNAARKRMLVRHGFRLPSAMENRPLSAREFWQKSPRTIFVSATPGPFEVERSASTGTVEAVIRPTGVLDPTIEVCGTKGQIEHLTLALTRVVAEGGKAIVTTLTKRFAEDLADCLAKKRPVSGVLDRSLRVSFLHSGIDSVGRMQILEAMRNDSAVDSSEHISREDGRRPIDVVVGVNLLREGIDIPAVRLVAILDADSEGFLRGETALVQTIGRAARNVDGHVVMYADSVTTGMHRAIAETRRRRKLQIAYNSLYRITPTGAGSMGSMSSASDGETLLNRIRKLKFDFGEGVSAKSSRETPGSSLAKAVRAVGIWQNEDELSDAASIRNRMLLAAHARDFETAALLRDCLAKMGVSN